MGSVYIGKIAGFHGVKGELKIVSDFEKKDFVLKKDKTVLIDNESYKITSSRVHKNNYLLTFNSMFDLNLVDNLIGKDLYIKRGELNLKKDEYLLNDLIGYEVYDALEIIGKVTDISYNVNCKFLRVVKDKSFLIPLIDQYVKEVDTVNKKIITINGKDLIL